MDHWTMIKTAPFLLGCAFAIPLARRARAAGASWRFAVGGGLLLFGSIVLGFLMTAHTIGAPLFRYLEPQQVPASAGRSITIGHWRYDFRLYSLILMGVVMLRYALTSLRAAAGVTRGDPLHRRQARTATAWLAALTAPLIPLSFEAWLYAAVLLLNVVALVISRAPAAKRSPTPLAQHAAHFSM